MINCTSQKGCYKCILCGGVNTQMQFDIGQCGQCHYLVSFALVFALGASGVSGVALLGTGIKIPASTILGPSIGHHSTWSPGRKQISSPVKGLVPTNDCCTWYFISHLIIINQK